MFEGLYADAHRLEPSALTRLSGEAVIGEALEAGVVGCHEEVRTAHPGGGRPRARAGGVTAQGRTQSAPGHPAADHLPARHFDEAWDRSVPVRPERVPLRTPVVTSDLQRTILQAVVGGETDQSIARRLGMSRRSVAEHVRRVSEQLGSRSRAQLGYLVATSGLLEA